MIQTLCENHRENKFLHRDFALMFEATRTQETSGASRRCRPNAHRCALRVRFHSGPVCNVGLRIAFTTGRLDSLPARFANTNL